MELGQYIKEKRKAKNLTLREAAKRSGVSHPYLSQLENGRNDKPSPDILNKLAKALDIPNGDLLMIAGYIEDPFEHMDSVSKYNPVGTPYTDIHHLLDSNEEAYYNGKLLTPEQKKRAAAILDALFKED